MVNVVSSVLGGTLEFVNLNIHFEDLKTINNII